MLKYLNLKEMLKLKGNVEGHVEITKSHYVHSTTTATTTTTNTEAKGIKVKL